MKTAIAMVGLATLLVGCTTNPPSRCLRISPAFRPEEIRQITILPAHWFTNTSAKPKPSEREQLRTYIGRRIESRLRSKNYALVVAPPSTSFADADGRLHCNDRAWIRSLPPDNARWVLMIATGDIGSKFGLAVGGGHWGKQKSVLLMGWLYDKESGETLWTDVGIGITGGPGLIGVASATYASAFDKAIDGLISHFPENKKPR